MSAPDLIDLFGTPHNRTITWNHLLRQTSDWEGTLWGKPDWADRPSDKADEWLTRQRPKAGTAYKYNDTRVNVLALATLNIWRRPLPQVLKEKIMDPIGASNTWRWFGYDNAWIVLDGQPVQSVTGGGHWGGGMFINAYDMARFGLLTLHKGKWGDRQLLSEHWIGMALTPTGLRSPYGFINYSLEHRSQADPERASDRIHPHRQRSQPDLCRSGERPGRGGAMDRERRDRRIRQAAARRGGGQELKAISTAPLVISEGKLIPTLSLPFSRGGTLWHRRRKSKALTPAIAAAAAPTGPTPRRARSRWWFRD